MVYEDILCEKSGGKAVITVNRPHRLNAMRLQTLSELTGALQLCAEDPEVGVVVITGAGERAFCSGGEVTGEGFDPEEDRIFLERCMRLSQALRGCGKPVIAKVRGYCVGAGNELNVQCDLTVAGEGAMFGQVGPKMGSFPGWYGTQLLPRLVGDKRAREIVFLCRRYTAHEAQHMGWVNKVVPEAELDSEVDKWCEELLDKGPEALRLAKISLNAGADLLFGSVEHAVQMVRLYHLTPESREGFRAFSEKRRPDFRQFRKRNNPDSHGDGS